MFPLSLADPITRRLGFLKLDVQVDLAQDLSDLFALRFVAPGLHPVAFSTWAMTSSKP
jgi:hypothetical protein